MDTVINLEKKGMVAWLTMNRPEALNSLNLEMADALVKNLKMCGDDVSIRVIVLTGAGRAFCAGGDLKALEALDSEKAAADFVSRCANVVKTIMNVGKPVIAMVNGAAAGAGFNLALSCDIIVAAKGARFIQSFSSVGLIPDCGGHWLLTKAVGPWTAKKLMYLAEPVDAQRGLEMGFVDTVSQPESIYNETAELAEKLAARPPLALAACKRLINLSYSQTLENILELESAIQGRLLMGEDFAEGIEAFLKKRKPYFKGNS
jgi:2-(1,2-epoxy-1,2-dihydrophenyl)acetyl-CoA isomerase